MAHVLVIGSGAREHAISRQFLQSPHVDKVTCAPGNPGMLIDGIEIVAIDELDFAELIEFAQRTQVALTFVGPEAPLHDGIVDAFQAAGLSVFGPNQAAAQIEGSKTFAKELMTKMNIPTARYKSFTDEGHANLYLQDLEVPIVIKADGLAAGKGVIIADALDEAERAVHDLLSGHQFGTTEIVIEEFLKGQEFSFFSFVHAGQIIPMPIAQDHKPAYDGDKGPNTGGMGAYSPVPQISAEMVRQAYETVIQPIIQGMTDNGTPFTGILYTGLIATAEGPKVIEFNARFGDPETSVVLPQLRTDFYELITDLLAGRPVQAEWNTGETYLSVGIASEDYPLKSGSGVNLSGFANVPDNVHVDYAGVRQVGNRLESDGGRILSLVTNSSQLTAAQSTIYDWLQKQELTGLRYRHDIGDKALTK